MDLFQLCIAYLRYRSANSILNIILLGFGAATIIMLVLLSKHLDERFDKDAAGIDLVVGAKGSPLQLVLSSLYHIDIPTGNISLTEAKRIMHHPQVKLAIPISLGDNYEGYRIVGTDPLFTSLYAKELAAGRLWHKSMEAVIGYDVAVNKGLSIGNIFASGHGLTPSNDIHDNHPYEVVGIMPQTKTVMDRLVLTSLESVWEIHQSEEQEEHHTHTSNELESKVHIADEITAILIQYKSPVAALTLPRIINQSTRMQASSPAFELARVYQAIGVGKTALNIVGYGLILFSGLSVFLSLTNTMRDRQYDIAIMRVLGAGKARAAVQLVFEAYVLVIAGLLLGEIIARGSLFGIALWLGGQQYNLPTIYPFYQEEGMVWIFMMIAATIAAVYPAIRSYCVNVASILVRA